MQDSKECFKCHSWKPLSEFYKQSQMADGHLNKCKECTKTDTKANYERNQDYYKEYNRTRDQLPHRLELKKRYSQTEEGKAAGTRAKAKWAQENVIKRAASHIVNNAVRDGKIIKSEACEACGDKHPRIHGHHDDYNFPMKVRWLCPKCHTKWHKENTSTI